MNKFDNQSLVLGVSIILCSVITVINLMVCIKNSGWNSFSVGCLSVLTVIIFILTFIAIRLILK